MGEAFSLVRFCMLHLKSKNWKGPFAVAWMRFPGIRLVEQTEQNFSRKVCLEKKRKKRVTVIVRLFY